MGALALDCRLVARQFHRHSVGRNLFILGSALRYIGDAMSLAYRPLFVLALPLAHEEDTSCCFVFGALMKKTIF